MASERIGKRIAEVRKVEVLDFTRDMSFEDIPTGRAYRMDAAHLYADVVNLDEMLGVTSEEGVTCHRRTLRFLNLHYRAVQRVLSQCDARRVDFHNQRLHAVIAKPYGEESQSARVDRAVAIADLIIGVLKETGDTHEKIPAASVRVGIDTGRALVVNNGRSGNREPLLLGRPANNAAKIAGHQNVVGIFLSNEARKAIGLSELKNGAERTTALTAAEIATCAKNAALGVTKDQIVDQWRKDLEDHPIGEFEFSRHTPPLRTLDIAALTPKNSRRMEAVSVYADIDGFTNYVSKHIDNKPEDVVRCLHVIRAELDGALSSDFDGRRVRFIGDCIHGLLAEGTAQTTDVQETISAAVLCVGALRSSFELSRELLANEGVDVEALGLAVGFEYGPMTVTRLGLQGDRVRCSVSRGVLASEAEQRRCNGQEAALGASAYEQGTDPVRKLFGSNRKIADLDYDVAVDALAAEGDRVAKASLREALQVGAPGIITRPAPELRPHCG